MYKHESTIGIHMSPPSWTSLPPPTPSGYHRALDLSSLHERLNFSWLSNFKYGNAYVSKLLSQFFPPSPSTPLPTQVCVHKSLYGVKVKVTQSCLTLWDPMDHGPPGSSVCGILQARILEWAAMPFSSGSFRPWDQTWVFLTAGRFFTVWATWECLLRELKTEV